MSDDMPDLDALAAVEEFLTQRATMRGLDHDHVTAANYAVLRVTDLTALIARVRDLEAAVERVRRVKDRLGGTATVDASEAGVQAAYHAALTAALDAAEGES